MSRVSTLLAALMCLPSLATASAAADLRPFDDAALHAVQFVDEQVGWAVGDDGVIWHTIDGGRNWERQPSGTRASLRSLHFLTPFAGWVVGREELPDGRSIGVVLFTEDEGFTWKRKLANALPGLNVVRFADPKNPKVGYLVGDGSDQHPSGVFVTNDGGREWQPVPGPRVPTWLAADFNAESGGALGGAWNKLGTVRRDRVGMADEDMLEGRSVRGLQLRGKHAVAVGQGGLVLISQNTAGAGWAFPKGLKLSDEMKAGLDFHAVHGAGAHVWAVGRPGSVALHSPDFGQTWEMIKTGQPMPLNGVFFLDEKRGWAVGELGCVVGTTDGGKTWKLQRRGGQRAAVLCANARSANVPLDTVALLGGEEGYFTVGVQVVSPDPATAPPAHAAGPDRLRAAFRQSGGTSAEVLWQFPLPAHLQKPGRDDLLHAWNARHGGKAADQLLRQLVLALRVWRPDVVLTDHPDAAASSGSAALVAEAMVEAVRRAADPEAFPEQLAEMGLSTWKVAKVYGGWHGKEQASVALDSTAPLARLESTAREFATTPAGLVGDAGSLPSARYFRHLGGMLEGGAGHRDLMQGVSLAFGGPARRDLQPAGEVPAEVVKGVRARANLRTLADNPAGPLTDPDKLLAQIGPTLAGMDDDKAAPVCHAIAAHFARDGQWTLARETYLLMTERYPAHPLTADAYRWLIRHNASSEARRRHDLGQFLVVGVGQLGTVNKNADPLKLPGRSPLLPAPKDGEPKTPTPEVPRIGGKEGGALVVMRDREQTRKWYQGCVDMAPKLAAFGPAQAGDPSVQFGVQAARRALGDPEAALTWCRDFASKAPDGPWREAALAELWLAERKGQPPKPVIGCRYAETRPFLDGKLDDACWQGGVPLNLRDAAGGTAKDHSTEVRMAHDKEYLYLAVKCGHPAGTRPEVAPKGRGRDADLRGHDRVSLLLDLDRDYATFFHLQVDRRGLVWDDCWGDRSWNPKWFVATTEGEDGWAVEAAIPMGMLSGDAVTAGKAWACNVVRVLPGRGVQAWSVPAAAPEETIRPEGLGLLLFAPSARREDAASR